MYARTVTVRHTLHWSGSEYRLAEPKSARSRRVVVLSSLGHESLRAHRLRQAEERLSLGATWEEYGMVFTNGRGRPLTARNMTRRAFKPLLEKAGTPYKSALNKLSRSGYGKLTIFPGAPDHYYVE